MFITFEGVDGSGKSTQARLLAEGLETRGLDVLLTREPGGSPGAEEIRALVLRGDPGRWSPEAELLLFNAARRDHVERTIRPALEAGRVVICDRFADSTRVYQGAAGPGLREAEDWIHARLIGLEPDLVILIDMDPAVALHRGLARKSGEDRFEDMGLAFQQRQRAAYLDLARASPTRFAVFDGGQQAETLAAQVLSHALKCLGQAPQPEI
jgi:dTMP kinase